MFPSSLLLSTCIALLIFLSPTSVFGFHRLSLSERSSDDSHYKGNTAQAMSAKWMRHIMTSYHWCSHESYNFCTPQRNQYTPQQCGSSYVLAALSTIADRMKGIRREVGTDLVLSPQGNSQLTTNKCTFIDDETSVPLTLLISDAVLSFLPDYLDCAGDDQLLSRGCEGGTSEDVYEFVFRHGIVEESCNAYVASTKDRKCDWKGRCKTCMPVRRHACAQEASNSEHSFGND